MAGTRAGLFERGADDPLATAAGEDRGLDRHLFVGPLVQPAADVGVLALGVFAEDQDVDGTRSLVAKRTRHAGIKITRAEADALVKPPANGQQEPVKRDVVLDLRMADRSQKNGVMLRQRVEKIGRSHPAVGEVVVRSPRITGPLERGVLTRGGRVGGADRLRGDLRPNSVPFDDGDLEGAASWRFPIRIDEENRCEKDHLRTVKPTDGDRWA